MQEQANTETGYRLLEKWSLVGGGNPASQERTDLKTFLDRRRTPCHQVLSEPRGQEGRFGKGEGQANS
jgi:hypothetical protein